MRALIIISLILNLHNYTYSQLRITVESGLAFTGYNDVRVPNGDINPGQLFSLLDDFNNQSNAAYFRAEVAYTIANRHVIEATAAPLQIDYSNFNKTIIDFDNTLFTNTNSLTGRYEFNTYRLSYRYALLNKEKIFLSLGGSVLTRDARIAVSNGIITADDTDLGFVPLVSFEFNYLATEKLTLHLKGDALVGPVGRAEDVFAGVKYSLINNNLDLKLGYRIIEGGADVAQVYNFALIHFASGGLAYTF